MNNEMREIFIETVCNCCKENNFCVGDCDKCEYGVIADEISQSNLLFNPETDVRAKFKKGDVVPTAKKGLTATIENTRIEYLIRINEKPFDTAIVPEYIIEATELEAKQAIKDREWGL